MRTRIMTITQLKKLFVESFLNNTNNVSKISDGSVLNGTAFGVAKLSQKVQKDIALLESRLFPSTSFGVYLDDVASEMGIAARFGATQSSTYMLVVGTAGTTYTSGVQVFSTNTGVSFDLPTTFVMPAVGYAYILVRSSSTGSKANVDALTISNVAPIPAGHTYCINEFAAMQGRDSEDDIAFRLRIRDTPDIASTDTLSRLTQVFIKYNSKVMRLFYYGISSQGKTQIAVLTQDGSPLSNTELNNLLVASAEYLCVSDLRAFGDTTYGIDVQNIQWTPIDISITVDLDAGAVADNVRRDMQVAVNFYFDYRVWDSSKRVQWVDLLEVAKSVDGVRYAPDDRFSPSVDIIIANNMLPRVRSFKMLDMNGNVISDGGNLLNPIYLPQSVSSAYQATILVSA